MVRVLANDSGDRGLVPGQLISKTQKMVLASLPLQGTDQG